MLTELDPIDRVGRKLGGLRRFRSDDDPEVLAAVAELTRLRADRAIRRAVETGPVFSPADVRALVALVKSCTSPR